MNIDKFTSYLKEIQYNIDVDCFTKYSLPHIKPNTLRVSMNLPTNDPFFDGDDERYYGKLSSIVNSELTRSIIKFIIKDIFDSERKSLIDLINRFGETGDKYQISSIKSSRILEKIKCDISQKYLLTNSRISSEYFMNLSSFVNFPLTNKVVSSGSIYTVGCINLKNKREIWVDPYMKWDDNYILCFDDVNIDVGNYSFSVMNSDKVSPKFEVSLDLRYELVNTEVFFIFENDFMKNINEYKKINRDNNINILLD